MLLNSLRFFFCLWAASNGFFGPLNVATALDNAMFHRIMGRYLGNHVIGSLKTESEIECGNHCLNEAGCASVNFKAMGNDKGLCELNSKTLDQIEDGGQKVPEYIYLGVFQRSCKENETFSAETKKCEEYFTSCKEVLERSENSNNGIYALKSINSDEFYNVYCHMTDLATCGGRGWTLALKLDGNKNTFTYDSALWTNKQAYAVEDGLEGLTQKESKLASYWNTPFTKVCLGMSYNDERKWMPLSYTANSLYSVIADGQYHRTTAGRATWKSLIADSSLQWQCRREGFNVEFNTNSMMRIGIVTNNENNCASCDSWIGFSVAYTVDEKITSRMVCGNKAGCCNLDNGAKTLNTFGYIFIQ